MIVLCLCAFPGWSQEPPQAPRPITIDILERTGIALMLLDVAAKDENGQPMPGLTIDDFEVRINGSLRPIYSVDDLCVVEGVEETEPQSLAAFPEAPVPARPRDPTTFILYIDFSSLTPDGRDRAVKAARSWIRNTMTGADPVQLVAYAPELGAKELTQPTREKALLLSALDRIDEDPRSVDTFPAFLESHIESCCTGCTGGAIQCCNQCCPTNSPECRAWAGEHESHARQALEAMQRYLVGLEGLHGRKALIYFHQQSTMFPGRAWSSNSDLPGSPGTKNIWVRDHVSIIDQLSADATVARTTIHTAYVGGNNSLMHNLASNLGANLADFTGGSYSRDLSDLSRVIDYAAGVESCVYRLGFKKPPQAIRGVLRAKVSIKGEPLPFRYRVQFLDESARWWREARSVMDRPESATDVKINAALVPRAREGKRWDMSVEIALDVASLTLLEKRGNFHGDWEVGAVLSRNDGGQVWEMLGVSNVVLGKELAETQFVVHRRMVKNLKPGEYVLKAFVKDRITQDYGGGAASVSLPKADQLSMIGPIMMRPGEPYVESPLPLMREEKNLGAERGSKRKGDVPAGTEIMRGREVEILTWVCAPFGGNLPKKVQRFVSNEEAPLFRLDRSSGKKWGNCRQVVDKIDTAPMQPGDYVYHVSVEGAQSQLLFSIQASEESP